MPHKNSNKTRINLPKKIRTLKANLTKLSFRSILAKLFKFTIIAAIWSITIFAGLLLYFSHDLPDIEKFGQIKKIRKITIANQDGEILTNFGDLYGEYISYNQIPKHLIDAVVATEDRRFFYHFGIDPIGLLRAMITNLKAGRVVQGGSTISQQLAKIIYLSPDKTLKRKFQELILAITLESKLSKQQILEAYLNRVYLGSGIYGIDSAARFYFGKHASELNIKEAAIITGLLKAPTRYSPTNNAENSGKRAYQVLVNMADAGYLTNEQVVEISQEPVLLETSALGNMKQSYFTSWIVDQVNNLVADDGTDLVVYTTVSRSLQEIAEKILSSKIKELGKDKNVSQGAILALGLDGRVLALVGGKDFYESPFNRAVQAYRQPGSAFKHIVYVAAFEAGITPDDMEVDEPISIGKWQPRNSNRKFLGEMSIREAFARSVNTIAVKLSERIGIENVITMAKLMGISSNLTAHPSIALGSIEVNLLELVGSYTTIANSGYSVKPFGITKIATDKGIILYEKPEFYPEKIISDKAVSYAKEVMVNTIDYGSGYRAKLNNNILAGGKTGTSQENRDAWFIGFTDSLVVGVWVGNDDNTPAKAGGAYLPAMIWKSFMDTAYSN